MHALRLDVLCVVPVHLLPTGCNYTFSLEAPWIGIVILLIWETSSWLPFTSGLVDIIDIDTPRHLHFPVCFSLLVLKALQSRTLIPPFALLVSVSNSYATANWSGSQLMNTMVQDGASGCYTYHPHQR